MVTRIDDDEYFHRLRKYSIILMVTHIDAEYFHGNDASRQPIMAAVSKDTTNRTTIVT